MKPFSNGFKTVALLACLAFAYTPIHASEDSVGVIISTSVGDITLELYPQAAPLTYTNFMRYVDGGYYDNTGFYRTVRSDNQVQNPIKIEVIQGGLGMDDRELPYAPIAHETTDVTGIRHVDGAISMARGQPGTAASEFFICINDQPELDFGGQRNPDGQGFAAFGKVVRGMDVVRAIQAMSTIMPEGPELEYTSGQILIEPVEIFSISRQQQNRTGAQGHE